MPFNKEEFDVEPDPHGSFVVLSKNSRKLLYDGLLDTFSCYGKIVTIRKIGNKFVQIRYANKSSALNCYYDFCEHPDFMVELPHKCRKPKDENFILNHDLNGEARISVPKSNSHNQRIRNKENSSSVSPCPTVRYLCQKRKIIRSPAFKCFMNAASALNQYKHASVYYASLVAEVKQRVRNIKVDINIGFEDEVEPNLQENDTPHLVLAKDFYYFHISKPVTAVDVLICCLPPWYSQKDAYKLVLSLVPDDLLQIDWHRMYPSRTKDCSFPYGIVYLKTNRAAASLTFSADNLVIDDHIITVCLMEDVENILLSV